MLALLKKHMATIGASEGSSGAAVTEMRAQVCYGALNHNWTHELCSLTLSFTIIYACSGVAGAGLALCLEWRPR